MPLRRSVRCETKCNVWAVFVTHKKSIGQGGGQVTPTHSMNGWSCWTEMIDDFCSGGLLPLSLWVWVTGSCHLAPQDPRCAVRDKSDALQTWAISVLVTKKQREIPCRTPATVPFIQCKEIWPSRYMQTFINGWGLIQKSTVPLPLTCYTYFPPSFWMNKWLSISNIQ